MARAFKRKLTSELNIFRRNKKTPRKDQFLIDHVQSAQSSGIEFAQQVNQRRLVFISLLGLFRSWKQCDPYLLHSALLIVTLHILLSSYNPSILVAQRDDRQYNLRPQMPLKSQWIYHPRKHTQEMRASLLFQLSTFADKNDVAEFFELLKWKDSQQLVIWTQDEDDYSTDDKKTNFNTECSNMDKQSLSDPLIAPFWRFVSRKLTNLVDPVTGNKYNPLKDTAWWQGPYRQSAVKSVHDVPVKSILVEMYCVTMKFKTVSEMIYQSNPSSLQPVVCYTGCCAPVNHVNAVTASPYLTKTGDDTKANDGWWISPDYDPYDKEAIA